MITVVYQWQGKEHRTTVPASWPESAVAEVCAFRAGAVPGFTYEFVGDVGVRVLLAVGAEL